MALALLTLIGFHQQASAYSDSPEGLSGRTNKDGGTGCAVCHGLTQDPGMTVTLSGPATLGIYSRGTYTVTATRTGLGLNGSNRGVKMGMAVAASDGPPTPLAESSTSLVIVSSGEVIHNAAGSSLNETNDSGSASYTFYYTMPAAAALGSVHTIYAVARLGGSSNGGAGGGWKHALNLNVTATTGPPSPPTIGTATAGNAQASVSFTAPVSGGGSPITSYTAISAPGGLTGSGTASPIIVGGLTNGATYTFRVKATNALNLDGNDSAPSNAVIPGAPPGPPANVSAIRGNAEATVVFSPPASNGTGSISSYAVTANPGGVTAMGSASPLIVPGLTNGVAYTFTVTATSTLGANVYGPGIASSPSNAVTPEPIPGPPTAAQATPGNTQATVTFNLPASSGGSAISGFTVTSIPPGGIDSNAGTTSLSHVVTGLANGTSYTFTVTATNASGDSVASLPSSAVVPRTIPGAPTGVTATPAGGAASVAFVPPVDNGGSAVTSYIVTSIPPGGQDANVGSGYPNHTITNLANGTPYAFTVVATNVAGNGPPSVASNSVIPFSGNSPTVLWTRELPRAAGSDAYCVTPSVSRGPAIDASGNVFVNGCSLGVAGEGDVVTHKIDGATGAVLWSASYKNFPKPDHFPIAHGLVVDFAGNVLLTSTLRDSDYKNSIRTIKYSGATGAELWNVGFSAATDDESNSDIAVDGFGDVFVTGYGGSGMRTIKYDGTNGLEKWVAKDLLYGYALAVDFMGDVVVTGYDRSFDRNFQTIKYSGASGIKLWSASFSSTTPNSHDTGLAVAFGTGGNVFVTGATGNTSQTIKYNGATGAEIWSVPSNLPAGQWEAIAVDAAGNPVVVGASKDTPGDYNIRTVKYDGATGTELWSSAYNGSANSADFGHAIAIDADGNVVVTGASRDTVGGNNIRAIKYNGTTGAQIWSHAYVGPAPYDQGRQVGVGPGDTIHVFGILNRYYSNEAALVQKLAPVGAPGAPIILSATAGYGQFSLGFNPPDSNGGAVITLYTATCTASGQATRTNSAMTSPIVVTGAIAGVSYACTIIATNSAGPGSPSFSVTASALSLPAPTVTAIAPPDGPNTGGAGVTITGTGFVPGASVAMGGAAATNVIVSNATTITATTGAHTAGLADVVITNPDAKTGTLEKGFAYLSAHVLDVDVNGGYDALTDGLLTMRYLSGLTGTALTAGALGGGAALTDPAQLVDYLNYIRLKFDVDGNGNVDAPTDGVMLIRYLFGLRGPMLTTGAIGAGATRTPEEMETYIQTLMP